ncbi:MAG: DCC1-like thiol-disulfide oxidoreductase family protein [Saprospiraceae bacterium]
MIKYIIETYWQSAIVNGTSFLTSNAIEKTKRAKFVATLFYLFVFATSVQTFSVYSVFPEWDLIINSKELFDPIWTVKWVPLEYWETCVRSILFLFLTFSFFALIFWERSRLIRVGVFASMFFYLSLISSFGKIDHFMHIMTIASFLLIFAPTKKSEKISPTGLLQVIFGIQTFILLAYFVSGFFKIYGIVDQELRGVTSALSPEALGRNVSKTSLAYDLDFFLSSFILDNPSGLFSIGMIVGYLIELFSIYIIFKPNSHRIWGLLLMVLHAGILLSVGPDFSIQIFLVGIFLFLSPFANLKTDTVGDVSNIWTSITSRFKGRNATNEFIVFYDGDCLMCNSFITYLAKFDLPEEIRLCTLKSDRFEKLLQEHQALSEIDSIVVVETNEAQENTIRIKANGILWVLSKLTFGYKLLRYVYSISPFTGNAVYDIVAKNRTIPGADNCPIPPEKIRKIIVS